MAWVIPVGFPPASAYTCPVPLLRPQLVVLYYQYRCHEVYTVQCGVFLKVLPIFPQSLCPTFPQTDSGSLNPVGFSDPLSRESPQSIRLHPRTPRMLNACPSIQLYFLQTFHVPFTIRERGNCKDRTTNSC